MSTKVLHILYTVLRISPRNDYSPTLHTPYLLLSDPYIRPIMSAPHRRIIKHSSASNRVLKRLSCLIHGNRMSQLSCIAR